MDNRAILYLVLMVVVGSGCLARNMYSVNQDQREYDKEEAAKAIADLHDGVLAVAVPTDHRKISLLEAVVAKYPNKKGKEKELAKAKEAIANTRSDFIDYFSMYNFSEYQLIDDTLVRQYMASASVPATYDASVGPQGNVQRDTTRPTFLCRAGRVHDDIGVYYADGSFIPAPFPFGSQLSLSEKSDIESEELSNDRLKNLLEESLVGHAILVLDAKLWRMHTKLTPQVK